MKNNVNILDSFLRKRLNKLLFINKNSEEIDYFYFFLINYFSQKNHIKVKIGNSNNPNDNDIIDLFDEENKLIIYHSSNKQIINKLITNNEQKIIFINYKDFKNLKSEFEYINSFNFKNDLRYFIEDVLGISNDKLFNTVLNSPIFISSEINKYFINSKNYDVLYKTSELNKIEDLRKKIYQTKDNHLTLFKLIKEEVNLKKLSFLTY